MNGVTTARLSPVATRWNWELCENAESRSGTERPYASLLYPCPGAWLAGLPQAAARSQVSAAEKRAAEGRRGWQFGWGGSLLKSNGGVHKASSGAREGNVGGAWRGGRPAPAGWRELPVVVTRCARSRGASLNG